MHGRLKVRTTEEQKQIKDAENQKKLKKYRDAMDLIAKTRHEEPYNATSFGACTYILALNPDIYTLWNYRKEVTLQVIGNCKNGEIEIPTECEIEGQVESENKNKNIEKLSEFMDRELALTEQCLVTNPKSYGAWHHRYWILGRHPKPNWNKEFTMITKYLKLDDRNFHAWDYRRLILKNIDTDLKSEIQFSTDRINDNFSNYSSWHYRSTLRELDETSIEGELDLVKNAIFTDPYDSSTWFFLRWLLSNKQVTAEHLNMLLDDFKQLLEMEPSCKWIYLALSWTQGGDLLNGNNAVKPNVEEYNKLIEVDPLRTEKYKHFLSLA